MGRAFVIPALMALSVKGSYASSGRLKSETTIQMSRWPMPEAPKLEKGLHKAVSVMDIALEEAAAAGRMGEVPVGAVILGSQGQILARAGNRTRTLNDPTAHAEMLAIRTACAALSSERLPDCSLYVTLEPCAMCAAAISFARIKRLYFGAGDPKGGGIEHGPKLFTQPTCHHAPEIYSGIGEQAAADLLRNFFRERR
jgi:tRNA(adenine34) deaminase